MGTTTNEPPEQHQTGGHSERLLRAQAAELQALRDRVADLPDVDTLSEWRASHEQLTQLRGELPAWREQLQAAHHAEQAKLQGQVQQQQQALQDAQMRSDLQAAFISGGGNIAHFPAWLELYGSKYVKRGENGAILATDNGQDSPLSDALMAQRSDSLYGVFFHPRYGSGGGATGSGRDVRVINAPNLQNVKTGELFRRAFGRQSHNNLQ